LTERLNLAGVNIEQPLEVSFAAETISDRLVGNIQEADVIVLAIVASGDGLVDTGEIARPRKPGSPPLLHIVAIGYSALFLIAHLNQAGAEAIRRTPNETRR